MLLVLSMGTCIALNFYGRHPEMGLTWFGLRAVQVSGMMLGQAALCPAIMQELFHSLSTPPKGPLAKDKLFRILGPLRSLGTCWGARATAFH